LLDFILMVQYTHVYSVSILSCTNVCIFQVHVPVEALLPAHIEHGDVLSDGNDDPAQDRRDGGEEDGPLPASQAGQPRPQEGSNNLVPEECNVVVISCPSINVQARQTYNCT
jgi:hypothetical protein